MKYKVSKCRFSGYVEDFNLVKKKSNLWLLYFWWFVIAVVYCMNWIRRIFAQIKVDIFGQLWIQHMIDRYFQIKNRLDENYYLKFQDCRNNWLCGFWWKKKIVQYWKHKILFDTSSVFFVSSIHLWKVGCTNWISFKVKLRIAVQFGEHTFLWRCFKSVEFVNHVEYI